MPCEATCRSVALVDVVTGRLLPAGAGDAGAFDAARALVGGIEHVPDEAQRRSPSLGGERREIAFDAILGGIGTRTRAISAAAASAASAPASCALTASGAPSMLSMAIGMPGASMRGALAARPPRRPLGVPTAGRRHQEAEFDEVGHADRIGRRKLRPDILERLSLPLCRACTVAVLQAQRTIRSSSANSAITLWTFEAGRGSSIALAHQREPAGHGRRTMEGGARWRMPAARARARSLPAS